MASDTDVESSASDIEVIGEPEKKKQSVSQLVSRFHMTDTLFLQDSHLSLIDQAEYWPGVYTKTSMYSPV